MVNRRRLVVVVVVHVQPRVTRAAFGDEVDQLLERPLLARPVIGPDLGVPGRSRLVGLGRVHHAEQVLQPELPAVLGVVPGALDIEEQVPAVRFRQREQPAVGHQLAVGVPFGCQELVPDDPVVAGHLQPGLLLGAFQGTGLTRSSRGRPASPANPRRVEVPASFSARRCPAGIPATSDRSSSARLRSRHMSRHRQMAQCSTGSGYTSAAGSAPMNPMAASSSRRVCRS